LEKWTLKRIAGEMCFNHTTGTPEFADDFLPFQAAELEQRMECQQAEWKAAAPEVASFKTSMYLLATFNSPQKNLNSKASTRHFVTGFQTM